MVRAHHAQVAEALTRCFGQGDCVVAAGDKELRVWSPLLAAWSHVFRAMFTHSFAERAHGRIEITDCAPEAVEAALRFFYSGELDCDPVLLLDVVSFADKEALAASMTESTAVLVLREARARGLANIAQQARD